MYENEETLEDTFDINEWMMHYKQEEEYDTE